MNLYKYLKILKNWAKKMKKLIYILLFQFTFLHTAELINNQGHRFIKIWKEEYLKQIPDQETNIIMYLSLFSYKDDLIREDYLKNLIENHKIDTNGLIAISKAIQLTRAHGIPLKIFNESIQI